MNEPFVLAINYLRSEHEFKARFERWGYTHRIAVLIGEETFVFEPDEEGSYRALYKDQINNSTAHFGLLQAIAEKLKSLSE